MKTSAILFLGLLSIPSVYANSCNATIELAINEIVSVKDENASVIAVRHLGNLEAVAFQSALLGKLESYYVTTSDESGGCVWHVVSTQECAMQSLKEVTCF